MENIQNYKDALASVSKKEMEQRKTIKRLLQEKEELKKQLALYGVSQQRERLQAFKSFCSDNYGLDIPDRIIYDYKQSL